MRRRWERRLQGRVHSRGGLREIRIHVMMVIAGDGKRRRWPKRATLSRGRMTSDQGRCKVRSFLQRVGDSVVSGVSRLHNLPGPRRSNVLDVLLASATPQSAAAHTVAQVAHCKSSMRHRSPCNPPQPLYLFHPSPARREPSICKTSGTARGHLDHRTSLAPFCGCRRRGGYGRRRQGLASAGSCCAHRRTSGSKQPTKDEFVSVALGRLIGSVAA